MKSEEDKKAWFLCTFLIPLSIALNPYMMPRLLYIILLTLLSTTWLSGQEKEARQDLTNTLVSYIREGDATSLASHFQATLDIGLPEKDQDYSKTQAEMVLKDFFNNNPCTDFKIESSGDSENQTFHIIGIYHSNQEKYQMLLLMKKQADSDKMLIFKIKFEKKK